MRTLSFSAFLLGTIFLHAARADLTIVQKIEGGGPVNEMTIKIKGDKARVEATPEITAIIDSKTGEMVNLMHKEKRVMRISAETAKAAAEMANRFSGDKGPKEKPKLMPTGKKETINGYEAAEYVYDTPKMKTSYWISSTYPNAAAILQQLQAMTPTAWTANIKSMPDFRDFPGLPLRTQVVADGKTITSTITSVKLDPLPDSLFVAPADYKETKVPDFGKMFGGKKSKAGHAEKANEETIPAPALSPTP